MAAACETARDPAGRVADQTMPPAPRAAPSLRKGRWVFSRFVGVRVTGQRVPHNEAWEAGGCGTFGPDSCRPHSWRPSRTSLCRRLMGVAVTPNSDPGPRRPGAHAAPLPPCSKADPTVPPSAAGHSIPVPGPEALTFSSPARRHPLPLPCQGLPAGSHPPPRAGVRALPINPRRTLPCASALSVCSLVSSLCPDGIPGRAWAARGRVLFCNLPPTPASPTQWLCVGCSGRVRGAQNQPCRKEGFLEKATSYH